MGSISDLVECCLLVLGGTRNVPNLAPGMTGNQSARRTPSRTTIRLPCVVTTALVLNVSLDDRPPLLVVCLPSCFQNRRWPLDHKDPTVLL